MSRQVDFSYPAALDIQKLVKSLVKVDFVLTQMTKTFMSTGITSQIRQVCILKMGKVQNCAKTECKGSNSRMKH